MALRGGMQAATPPLRGDMQAATPPLSGGMQAATPPLRGGMEAATPPLRGGMQAATQCLTGLFKTLHTLASAFCSPRQPLRVPLYHMLKNAPRRLESGPLITLHTVQPATNTV